VSYQLSAVSRQRLARVLRPFQGRGTDSKVEVYPMASASPQVQDGWNTWWS